MGRLAIAVAALWFLAAAPAGWKLYGTSMLGRDELRSFYGDFSLMPNGHVQVSTEDLTLEGLHVAMQKDPSLSNSSAKLATGYRPPLASVRALSDREILDAVAYEEIANAGAVTPRLQTVRELDCANRRERTIGLIEDGLEVDATKFNQVWRPIQPGSSNAILLQLVCR